MMAIKIHTSCFDGTRDYKVEWGKATGWYLNHDITAFVTATWKAPIWIIYFSLWLYFKAAKVFILMCVLSIVRSRD